MERGGGGGGGEEGGVCRKALITCGNGVHPASFQELENKVQAQQDVFLAKTKYQNSYPKLICKYFSGSSTTCMVFRGIALQGNLEL